jgi:hypothetical protein
MNTFVARPLTLFLAAAGATIIVACGSPQRPVAFATSVTPDAALDTVSRTLAQEGHPPATVDRQSNIVQSEWKDTGFLYGQIANTPATIVRRYTVTLAPAANGAQVAVRIDAKRCPQGGYTIGGTEVRGSCEELDAIPGKYQEELDALGATLRRALGSGAPPPATPAQAAAM